MTLKTRFHSFPQNEIEPSQTIRKFELYHRFIINNDGCRV